MKRRLFHAGAIVSLLLGLAAAGLWLRGLFVNDVLQWESWRSDEREVEVWVYQVSLAGCVWAHRSYRWYPHSSPERRADFERSHGPGRRQFSHNPRPVSDRWPYWRSPTLWGRLGFLRESRRSEKPTFINNSEIVMFPLWLVLLVSAPLPLVWAWRFRRERRRRRWRASGCCVACGYDLRSSLGISGAACPECGARIDSNVRL